MRQGQAGRRVAYPILWVAGVGLEQLPGTWYSLTWNRGGTFFDKDGEHQLGAGSVARETLKWWANTFEQGLDISDPESLKVQFTTSAKAFSAGNNLYRGPNHHYGLNIVNDPSQSPIAGKVKVHGFPGDGRTIGVTHVYFLTTANRDTEWAWKLLQYLGGRDKTGAVHAGHNLAQDAMLGQRLQSVMESDAVGRAGRRGVTRRPSSRCGTRRPTSATVVLALSALALPLDRPAQHRGAEVPDRPDHGRPVLRQPDQGHRQGQARSVARRRGQREGEPSLSPAESKADAGMAGERTAERRRELSRAWLALFMNTPSLLMMALVLAYPIWYAGYLSFHKVGIGQLRRGEFPFADCDNYLRLFEDPLFTLALTNTFIFTVIVVSAEVVLAVGDRAPDQPAGHLDLARRQGADPAALRHAADRERPDLVVHLQLSVRLPEPHPVLPRHHRCADQLGRQSRYRALCGRRAYIWRTLPFAVLLVHAALQGIRASSTRLPRSTAPPPGSAFATSPCRCCGRSSW